MRLEFEGTVIEWRGPAPFYYLPIPPDQSDAIAEVRHMVTYGWGVIPVEARIGTTVWTTSLFPKDGAYLLPLKDKIRKAERIEPGQHVKASITLDI